MKYSLYEAYRWESYCLYLVFLRNNFQTHFEKFFLISKRFLCNVVQFLSVIFRMLEFSDGKSIVFLMKKM